MPRNAIAARFQALIAITAAVRSTSSFSENCRRACSYTSSGRHAAIDERENRGVTKVTYFETRCWGNAQATNYGPSLGDNGQALSRVRSNNGLAAAF
jgi:hypothetical protein